MQSSSPPAVGLLPEPATPEEAVMVAMVRVLKLLRHRIPGEEIDFSALPLLKTLHHYGPMRVSALAGALDLDASTVSRHAKGLEDRGLLERTEDPDDGRASRVAVSPHGAACLDKGATVRRALIAQAMADWSEEDRETLRALLHRLVTDLVDVPVPHHIDTPTPTQEQA
ncbi:MAG: MarR family winged helix-turn-helix transcriptional regulator [Nocardioides sp.]